MSNLLNNAPSTLSDAQKQLLNLLDKQGWPKRVVWLQREDLLPKAGVFWVRQRDPGNAFQYAERIYEEGLRRGLGVSLEAVCADEKRTFAAVFFPRDEDEAQRLMIPRGLKVSVPVEQHAATTLNGVSWAVLRMRFAFTGRDLKRTHEEHLDQIFARSTRSAM